MKYTRQAFELLPKINEPQILDVGCGSGIPTIELAKLSKGTIVGIEPNQKELEKLQKKIKEEGLSSHVFTRNCSIMELDFDDETFDIIWAEGSLHIVGFEKSLKKLRRLLRDEGFIVVHDGVKDASSAVRNAADLGYSLVNHFVLPEDEWWINYFEPLEQLIKEHLRKPENKDVLEKYQNQLNMFKKNPKENVSGFYVFQKISC